jgi:hypothetical protein
MSLVIEEACLPVTLTASLMTDEEFVAFCARYPDYFIEMSAEGEILIMPPGGFLTSARVGEIFLQLRLWSRAGKRGWLPNPPAVSFFPTAPAALPRRAPPPRSPAALPTLRGSRPTNRASPIPKARSAPASHTSRPTS